MGVGGQGSHNKPTDCGACGAYAPGPDDKEDEEDCRTWQLSKWFIHAEHCNSAFLYDDIEEVFFFFLAGGKKTLQQSYIRRLANAMDELFLQKFGVHPSLVCDMYEYNYKKPGV